MDQHTPAQSSAIDIADEALVLRAQDGSLEAFAEIVARFEGRLFNFIARRLGTRRLHADAEDLTQETFLRAWRSVREYRPHHRFSTWLFTIAKRLYVNSIQKHRPTYDTDAVGNWQGSQNSPGHDLANRETLDNARQTIDFALGQLGPQQREIILLFHQQNWPITEIALYLNMPEGTIKSHLHRARKRMKKVIQASGTMNRQAEEVWS